MEGKPLSFKIPSVDRESTWWSFVGDGGPIQNHETGGYINCPGLGSPCVDGKEPQNFHPIMGGGTRYLLATVGDNSGYLCRTTNNELVAVDHSSLTEELLF